MGRAAPPSAVNALQTYVSRLRAALGGDILARRPAGYLLDIAPGQVDAHRFEQALDRGRRLLAAGDGAAALEVLAAAQALWRGGVLSDLAEAPFAQGEILRLSELRLVAAETHAEALLAAGRTAEAVAAAQALVAEHPLRERARAHLMLALYRDGRTTEALDAYREARRLLNEEFGIDPGTQLTALEGAILRQDPALTPAHPAAAGPAHQPSPSAVQAPATTAVTGHAGQAGRVDLPADRFIGRQRETAWIHHALTEHRLLTLTGPGGSGKTRLARHACHDRGLPVHVAELAELTDATLLEATLAQAFGLAVLADLTTVAAALGDGPVLLLLDNCEHLTHELAPVVARLLADVPGLRIVATSRSPLGVAGSGCCRWSRSAWPRPRNCSATGPPRCPRTGSPVPRSWRRSVRSARPSTACRWPWSWPPVRRWSCPRPRSSPGWTGWRRAACAGTCPTGTAPCATPSTSATGCSTTASATCSAASACSRGPSTSTPRRPSRAPAAA
ncbi:BTAD domain-containing putative transcriptional regulator [Catellatospora bangladeshensis]|uniref:AfsR/SARP family transcriptional regulator n=1 Tax=Catellatospora bangladeshensis TaxID=310355 RepID=UPI003622FC09